MENKLREIKIYRWIARGIAYFGSFSLFALGVLKFKDTDNFAWILLELPAIWLMMYAISKLIPIPEKTEYQFWAEAEEKLKAATK